MSKSTTKRPVGLVEVLSRIGDDGIQFQNLAHNVKSCRLSKNKKDSVITFVTDPAFMSADTLIRGNGDKLGLIVWVSKSQFEAVFKQAQTEPPPPSSPQPQAGGGA